MWTADAHADRAMRLCPLAQFGYHKRAKHYARTQTPWKLAKKLAESEPSIVDSLPAGPKDAAIHHAE